MKQDDIIRFAIQCRLVTTCNRDGLYMDALTEFAKLVAAKTLEQEYPYAVMFAVEQAVQNGSCFFEIENAFEDYEEARIARDKHDTR